MNIGWKNLLERKDDFVGGQVGWDYLGDTYRAIITDIKETGDMIIVVYGKCAVWYSDGWRHHSEEEPVLESFLENKVQQISRNSYGFFPAALQRNCILYTKNAEENIQWEEVTNHPIPA